MVRVGFRVSAVAPPAHLVRVRVRVRVMVGVRVRVNAVAPPAHQRAQPRREGGMEIWGDTGRYREI